MKIIKTARSEHIIVSKQDFDELSRHTWFLNNGYPFNKKLGYMHRLITNTPAGFVTDHKNGIRTDNQRENLRVATRSQNAVNKPLRNPIQWHKRCWRTSIRKEGKIYWKYSTDVNMLIEWRRQKAVELYGEYAYQLK